MRSALLGVVAACGFNPASNHSIDASPPIDSPVGQDSQLAGDDALGDSDVIPSDWWNTQWTKRSQIEIVNTGVTAELDNFPVLVTLTATTFDYADSQAAGTDLRFIAADNTTVLPYDIDTFATGGTSQIWVGVPAIAAAPSDHTKLWVYYGNVSASGATMPHQVWQDYVSVHHLADGNDATQNGHTGSTPNGDTATTAATGLIGAAQSFNGTSQAMQLATPTDFHFTSFTIGVWIDANPFTTIYQCFVCKGDSEWRLQRNNNNRSAEVGTTDTGDNNVDGNSTVDDNHWHFIAATFDAGNNFKKILYVDGAAQGSDNAGALATNSFAAVIGENQETNNPPHRYFSGLIDEVRTTTKVRAAAWIATEYAMIAGATGLTSTPIVLVHAVQSL